MEIEVGECVKNKTIIGLKYTFNITEEELHQS